MFAWLRTPRNHPATVWNWTPRRVRTNIAYRLRQARGESNSKGGFRGDLPHKQFSSRYYLQHYLIPAVAQDTAAITGRITDPSGAAVANATVTAKDVDRGTVFRTQTNADGVYNLPQPSHRAIRSSRRGQGIPDCGASRFRPGAWAKRRR